MSRLKKRSEGVKAKWTEELHNVLWSYQTTYADLSVKPIIP